MQKILRAALKYFAFFILLYGALTLFSLVPAVGSFCNFVYRQATEPILQTILPKAYLQLKGANHNPDILKTEYASRAKVQQQMEEARRSGQAKASIQGKDFEFGFYNLFLSFYLFLLALILLSPLSIREKITISLIGTVLFYLYTVFKIYLALLSHFNQPDIAIYQTGQTWLNISQSILYFMTLGANVMVVLTIWAVLVFRKNNWQSLLISSSNFFPSKK